MKIVFLIISIHFSLFALGQSTIDDGLIARYDFSGNADDASGNNNNGTVNGPTLTSDRNGNSNSAYHFDGIDDYIVVSNSNTLQASTYELSISLWVQINGYTGTPNKMGVFLEKGDGNFGDWGMYYSDTDNNPSVERLRYMSYIYHGSGGGGGTILIPGYWTTTEPTLNNWVHLVVTFKGDDANRYYINGEMESEVGNGGNSWSFFSNTANLFLGKSYQDTDFFNGNIDDVRIYNRELSAEEVCALYGNCIPTGITGSTTKDYIEIYPNPSSDKVFINNIQQEIKSIKLINQLGFATNVKIVNSNEVNIKEFISGVYIMEIELYNNLIFRRRIVKK